MLCEVPDLWETDGFVVSNAVTGAKEMLQYREKDCIETGRSIPASDIKRKHSQRCIDCVRKLEMPHLATVACNLHLTSNLISTD